MKKLCKVFLGFSYLMLVLHLAMLSMGGMMVDVGSLLLLVLPYGLPILIFSLANRSLESGKVWTKARYWMLGLFMASALAMFGHVTLAFFFSKNSFINVLFNVPLFYVLPMMLFALLWAFSVEKVRVEGENKKRGHVLSTIVAIIMGIHCGYVGITDYLHYIKSGPLGSSAPWYLLVLLLAFGYLILLGIVMFIEWLIARTKK